mmetsp:Transcript_55797/g.116723  ORF Transcript_55797/g.116723 Transcript_55797/m.116723 type:complete len:83 (+) Transcript_55797:185-433(+)
MQVTIKFNKRFLVLEVISRNALCSDLLPLLKAQLGSMMPLDARLMENGRFLRMSERIEEADLTGHCILEVIPGQPGGASVSG